MTSSSRADEWQRALPMILAAERGSYTPGLVKPLGTEEQAKEAAKLVRKIRSKMGRPNYSYYR
jgi:hypothetical protein